MAPYRSRERPRAPRPAPQTGLVADMVRQFADVHAFVRELVQNGIDAGATGIEVTAALSADGVASVRVADDGCGMTLSVIEDALLVLFRSTKDQDATKIGKYGVGFMSVLAIEPSEVTVDTWRAEGSYRVRLFPDHTYEIEHGAPRDGHGTCVTLSKSLAAPDFVPFWQKVAVSLHRWCRHAEVPIHFTVEGAGREHRRTRVDAPLDVRAIVTVRRAFDDMEIVIGPIAGSGHLPPTGTGEDEPAPFAGFYNRGLTLHETTAPLAGLEAVRLKVKSPRLCHTLSRDDVRRDQAFHLALGRAALICSGELRVAVLRELTLEARAAARGEEAPRLAALLEAATLPPVAAGNGELPLPLAHPIEGAETMTLVSIQTRFGSHFGLKPARALFTSERTDLTRALAVRGVPVVWGPPGRGVDQATERATSGAVTLVAAADECLLVRELTGAERLPGDDALCAGLSEALERAGICRVALGRMEGPRIGALVADPAEGTAEHVVLAASANVTTKKWPRGALLVLRADAEAVAAARRATSPAIGAHLLARYLLLTGPGLSSRASEALAVRALEEIR